MSDKLPWYKDGLRFKCTECGNCCSGSPGYVFVTEEDIENLSKFLGIGKEDFLRKYTYKVGDRISLKELPRPTYDCIFLKGRRCQVYPARPKQCRRFPWWKDILSSKEAWKETAERCEGIDHQDAPLISLTEIQKHLD